MQLTPIFNGQEALRLGLATRVCDDPRAEALAFAKEVAAKSPDAIRAGKRLLAIAAGADQRAAFVKEKTHQALSPSDASALSGAEVGRSRTG